MPYPFQSGWYTGADGQQHYGINPADVAAYEAQQANQNNTNPAPPVQTPAVATTPAQAYGSLLPTETPEQRAAREERARQARLDYTSANEPTDEATIRQNVLRRFQGEIDALNRIYEEKKREEQIKARGRLGSNTAIQARRGELGSTFGAAKTSNVEEENKLSMAAVQDEYSLEIGKIMGNISSAVVKEQQDKIAARKAGADNYLAFLEGEAERASNRISGTVQNLLALKQEPADETYKQLADALGTSPENLKTLYKNGLEAKTKAEEAERVKNIKTLSEGQSIYDPSTGKITTTAPKTIEPKVISAGQMVVDENGKVLYTAPNEPEKPLTLSPGQTLVGADGKPIYTAPAASETEDLSIDEKIKLKEKGFELDSSGNLVNSPETQKALSELQRKASTSANDLLTKFKEGIGTSAVGGNVLNRLGAVGDWLGKGTQREDFIASLENLKSLLSLDNVKYLKGQGQISDAERALLEQASSKLRRSLSEDEFLKTLGEITAGLSPVGTVVELGKNLYAYKNADTTVHVGTLGDNYTDTTTPLPPAPTASSGQTGDELDKALQELGFNKVGSDTNTAASYKGLAVIDTAKNFPGQNRSDRNNNPGNIKVSDYTKTFSGVKGVEARPAEDGGYFLVFNTPRDGMLAIARLLREGKAYKGVSAEAAIKKYNGGGAYGATTLGLNPNQDFQKQINNPQVLARVIARLVKAEGFTGNLA